MFDLLIKNVLIANGRRDPMSISDLAIKDRKIVAIAPSISDQSRETVDAAGNL